MLKRNFIQATSLLLVVVMLSSCATIFGSRYTKSTIKKPAGSKLLVNGENPEMKKGKVKLDKYGLSEQLTIKKEGFIDANRVVYAYKRNPATFISLIGIFTFLYDYGPKAKRYEKEIVFDDSELIPYPKKEEGDKEISINNVAFDVKAEDITYRRFRSYKHHKRKEEKKDLEATDDAENITLDNTIFGPIFNEILKESGYIDTTKRVLKNSYGNNLLLNATLEEVAFHQVGYNMIYTDLTIRWELLNYYKEEIFEISTNSRSGEYSMYDGKRSKEVIGDALSNAMEVGLVNFLNEGEVQDILQGNSVIESKEELTELNLKSPLKSASKISEVMNAGVTIENDDRHGSGFFINNDGYIITNYHVVSGGDKVIEVIDNQQKKYTAKLVRYNKAHDLALLKIEHKNEIALNLEKDQSKNVGLTVYALGTPSSKSLSQSISKGIISGYRDTEYKGQLIQTDVSVNPGNSGGALLSKEGVAIGVVSGKLVGYGVEGVAFCIPTHEVIEKLKLKL